MRLYNTLTRKKELLPAPGPEGLNLFVCGPTVYDHGHIGHARTYIFFDALVKFMRRRLGLKINYLQNITNIDDKIINRAQEENKDPAELADFFEKEYYQDMDALGVDSVDTYAPATDYIAEIISQAERLIKKGFAYPAQGSVYFDVRKFPTYGQLSRQTLAELKEGVRIEPEPGKKYFADFAIWKNAKPGEPFWGSPWGQGRPGWHIEDTTITEKHFGPRYHIHGGGLDLIFPHHEAEIAQMESLSGLKPLARVWIHTGLLFVDGEKMSKSLGNFVTIRDFLIRRSKEILRYAALSSHYRAPLDFSEKTANMAAASLERITDFHQRLKEVEGQAAAFPVDEFTSGFWDKLQDDFNSPEALAQLFDLIKEANKFINTHSLSHSDAQKIVDFVDEVNDIFGILPLGEDKYPEEIASLLKAREEARNRGDFQTADRLREKINGLEWRVDDTSRGPRATKIKN